MPGTFHIPTWAHHIRSHWRDIASGDDFRPNDLTEELRLDWDALTSAEKEEIRALAAQAAKSIKKYKDGGHQQRAMQMADEVAHAMAELVTEERIQPKPRRRLPDGHRELAALIRRR
jgi:hypothetical protein